jgi:DNA-directed RNA polymerase specialized sigma24 family protein
VLEPEGFREFVLARSPALLRTARLITGDDALAQDLVQSALARAWPRWARIESPEAYVRTAMVRTYPTWRRRRWHGEMPTERLPEPGGDGWEAVDLRQAVIAALGTPSPGQHAVLVRATSMTSPRPRQRTSWAARSGPSRASRRRGSLACAPLAC